MAKNKKPLNLDELSSLNLETGTQTPKEYLKRPKLYHAIDQISKGNVEGMPSVFGKLMKLGKFGTGPQFAEFENHIGPQKSRMKKGGKVKAKKPKDGRMKKAKCRDGIAQRGKTRGKIR